MSLRSHNFGGQKSGSVFLILMLLAWCGQLKTCQHFHSILRGFLFFFSHFSSAYIQCDERLGAPGSRLGCGGLASSSSSGGWLPKADAYEYLRHPSNIILCEVVGSLL